MKLTKKRRDDIVEHLHSTVPLIQLARDMIAEPGRITDAELARIQDLVVMAQDHLREAMEGLDR